MSIALGVLELVDFDELTFLLMLTGQDVLILDQSAFYGLADLHDRHRDMRLDVDNMSYEVESQLATAHPPTPSGLPPRGGL